MTNHPMVGPTGPTTLARTADGTAGRATGRAPGWVHDVDFAVTVARRAGAAMRAGRGAAATDKPDGTPVTDVDRAVGAMVAQVVAHERPTDAVLGEEDTTRRGGPCPGRLWVCDPVDGTGLFAADVPLSMFSLALLDDGVPVVAVVHDPWTDRMFHAVAGGGAFLDDAPIAVNSRPDLAGSRFRLPGGRRSAGIDFPGLLTDVLRAGGELMNAGSVIYDAMSVACGYGTGLVYSRTGPWDMAAVALIVAEAGGRVTDLHGKDVLTGDGSVLATNGRLHDELLGLVAGIPHGRDFRALREGAAR